MGLHCIRYCCKAKSRHPHHFIHCCCNSVRIIKLVFVAVIADVVTISAAADVAFHY